MFTPDEIEAGWLRSHTFTDGKGHHLTWTAPGAQRASLLKGIALTFGLSHQDRAPMAFDILVHGERPLPGFRFENHFQEGDPSWAAIAGFWRECVQELGLRGDEDGLLALVHIVETWAPDLDTPIRFI